MTHDIISGLTKHPHFGSSAVGFFHGFFFGSSSSVSAPPPIQRSSQYKVLSYTAEMLNVACERDRTSVLNLGLHIYLYFAKK